MSKQIQKSKTYEYNASDSIITPEEIYQTLTRQTPNLYPLSKFKTKASNKHIFPDAVKFPDFFNYNLISPARVIKRLEGRTSLIRGFYYQLMKLAFQIQVQDKDYIEVLKNVIFSPQFMLEENSSSPSSGKTYSDLQYKKIIAEFMDILIHQSIPNFELTILNYPILDEAMLKILENLLKFKNSIYFQTNVKISSFEVLQLLSETFQVTVIQYGNCYKFEQSDIFLYEHSKNEFYIAYLNEMAEVSDTSDNSQNKESRQEAKSQTKIGQQGVDSCGKKGVKAHEYLEKEQQIQTPIAVSQRVNKALIGQSLIYELDDLEYQVQDDDDKRNNKKASQISEQTGVQIPLSVTHKNHLNDYCGVSKNKISVNAKDREEIAYHKYEYQLKGYMKQARFQHHFNALHNYKMDATNKQQSLAKMKDHGNKSSQQKLNSTPTTTIQLIPHKQLQNQQQDIFYSPKQLIPKPTFLTQQSSSTNHHKKPIQTDESSGTLYRQFTNTKILQTLPQKIQQNIKRMKRKYKGVKSKDFFSGKIICHE